MIIKINSDNFENEVVNAEAPVLVDFWAEWCGPCRMVGPILEEVARAVEGSATIAKVNVDENPELAQRFGITAIPTLLIFENGEIREKLVGVTGPDELIRKLQPASAR